MFKRCVLVIVHVRVSGILELHTGSWAKLITTRLWLNKQHFCNIHTVYMFYCITYNTFSLTIIQLFCMSPQIYYLGYCIIAVIMLFILIRTRTVGGYIHKLKKTTAYFWGMEVYIVPCSSSLPARLTVCLSNHHGTFWILNMNFRILKCMRKKKKELFQSFWSAWLHHCSPPSSPHNLSNV